MNVYIINFDNIFFIFQYFTHIASFSFEASTICFLFYLRLVATFFNFIKSVYHISLRNQTRTYSQSCYQLMNHYETKHVPWFTSGGAGQQPAPCTGTTQRPEAGDTGTAHRSERRRERRTERWFVRAWSLRRVCWSLTEVAVPVFNWSGGQWMKQRPRWSSDYSSWMNGGARPAKTYCHLLPF
jgi:hypothetical protein